MLRGAAVTSAQETSWRLIRIPDHPGLNIRLVVDTTAPAVIEAIEQAAVRAGVWIIREEEQE